MPVAKGMGKFAGRQMEGPYGKGFGDPCSWWGIGKGVGDSYGWDGWGGKGVGKWGSPGFHDLYAWGGLDFGWGANGKGKWGGADFDGPYAWSGLGYAGGGKWGGKGDM